jgi:flagellar hook-basal body complex protein FliE
MALIPPVSSGVTAANFAKPLPSVQGIDSPSPTGKADFGNAVSNVLDSLQAGEAKTDDLAQQAATGRLQNVEEYLIAASESQLNMQLTVAVRNKAVEAFNEIMRMQV